MRDKTFLDTNILIYLYSESEEDKRETLCRILDGRERVTSLQALNEASNLTEDMSNGQTINGSLKITNPFA